MIQGFRRAEAEVSDVFSESTPSTRVVGAYGIHHRRPLAHWAAVTITNRELWVESGADMNGRDQDNSGECSGSAADNITGGIAMIDVWVDENAYIEGSPKEENWSGGYTDVYDSVGLRSDVLTDPNFVVEFEDEMPDFSALPSDSYPVVRYNGDPYAEDAEDGRGVLIVTGEFKSGTDHDWDGIILADTFDDVMEGDTHGIVVGGLDGTYPYNAVSWYGNAHYHSCDVYAANESLSYLELVVGTVFEVN